MRALRIGIMAMAFASCARPNARVSPTQAEYDLVIAGGRVFDPESGLDAGRNIGISSGVVRVVTTDALRGREQLDATGLVVAPGFIDLHQHAQDSAAYVALVRGGTTTVFELEEGTGDVDAWYSARAGRSAVHHGVAVGHIFVRARVFGDSAAAGGAAAPSGDAAHRAASDDEIAAIRAGLTHGLRRGAVAVGLLLGYTPGARPAEVLELFRAAAAYGASVHVHVRDLEEPLWYLEVAEVISASAATGAPGHLVHLNSTMGDFAPSVLDLLRGARVRGVDVSAEAYPYTAAMTGIEAAMFDDFASWPESKFRRYEWPATGERLTRESFARYRQQGGNVVIHPADSADAEKWLRATLSDTLTMIASDGILQSGVGHPRAVGTPARVLGRYVRDAGTLTLTEAVRRLTLAPARRLEARVPAMRRKGRVQAGADADLVLFDPATVRDEGTFRDPARPPSGIVHVFVAGVPVVRDGRLDATVAPGRAVRGPVAP